MNENILGYYITTKHKDHCCNEIVRWIDSGEKQKYFICANPHSLEMARNDYYFNESIINADLIIPDGIGIVIASKIIGGNIRDRVTGSDIFLGVSNILNRRKKKHSYFFLGSSDNTLSKIKANMYKYFPNIEVVGTYSPPFKAEFSIEDNQSIVNVINQAMPDILWVGMTAPKQEKWLYMNKNELDVKFIGPIGAVFDFFGGTKRRSHKWFQKHGIEWLPRLIREFPRLWYRTFVSHPRFIIRVFNIKLRRLI